MAWGAHEAWLPARWAAAVSLYVGIEPVLRGAEALMDFAFSGRGSGETDRVRDAGAASG